MKTNEFVTLYVMNLLSIFLGLFLASEYKIYWLESDNPPSDNYMATAGTIAIFFNGCRFIWAALLDHYPYKVVYGVLLSI
jgi:hypothetical protein